MNQLDQLSRVKWGAIFGIFAATHFAFAQTSRSTLQLPDVPVGKLQAQDKTFANYPPTSPEFRILGFSANGKSLLVAASEVGDREDEDGGRKVLSRLQFIDLEDGHISPLTDIQGNIDWFAGAPSSAAAVLTTVPKDKTEKGAPWITLGKPTNSPPPKDVLQTFTPGTSEGKAVYVAFVRVSGTGDSSQWRTFLVLRRAGQNTDSVQTYPVQLRAGDLFAPQWSPDGREVLLKVGNAGDRYNVYLMHFWNPETGELRQGPSDYISNLSPVWSPDSKRVAYALGGDIAGRIDPFTDLITLRIYDLSTGQSRTLVRNLASSDFMWTKDNSLLYTMPASLQTAPATQNGSSKKSQFPAGKLASPSSNKQETNATPARPSIYEVSINGETPKLIVADAYKPVPSPDGRWIAFFGWPDVEESQTEQESNPQARFLGPRLFLWDRQLKRRLIVKPNIFETGTQITWTPNSHQLVLLQSTYDAQKAQGTAFVKILTIAPDETTTQIMK